MIKKFLVSHKVISISSFVLLLFLVGGLNTAFAQTSLPAGGSSFETAVLLNAGKYQGGPIQEWQDLYYSIQVKAGQKVYIEAKSFSESGCTLYLYNEAQEELVSSYDTNPKINWLVNANKSSYNYYLKIANDASLVESFPLEVSLTNYYDANSQTDAGDSFDKALNIVAGNYSGYLSGNAGIIAESGDDAKDFYKVGLKKGITYNFKLTPPSKTELTLGLYDSNRQLLKEEGSVNKGGIVSLFLTPSADTNIFVSVSNSFFAYQDEFVSYQLGITTSVPVTEFYSCTGDYCESAGEFPSKEACQTATTKTCYTSANCDGKCGGTEPSGCTKNSDCPSGTTCVGGQCVAPELPPAPTCQDECSSGQTKCFDNFNYHKCGSFDEDDCLEWSTPVYCGEANKCESGKCAKAKGCQCSAWLDEGCGGGGCQESEMSQTRTCEPENCDKRSQCLSDPSCQVIPSPPVIPTPPDFPIPSGPTLPFFAGFSIWGVFAGWYSLLWILFYIYFAICLQFLAKRTNTPNEWLAWIPIANIFLMLNVAKKPLWWFILFLIPIVNIVFGVIVWMAIAERRGRPNWLGILIIVPFVGLVIPGYLAFSGAAKIETTPPYAPTGIEAANKPTVGYKHPCRYCGKLVPPNSATCPYCEKVNPLGPARCPKCHEPIEKDWKVCPKCNLNLRIICPFCGKTTFFGEHCEDCGARLLVACPDCGQEQPPLSDNCIKCGKPLKPKSKK